MVKRKKITIVAEWLEEDGVGVWYTSSKDVPGLHLETKTIDEGFDLALHFIPELLEDDHLKMINPIN